MGRIYSLAQDDGYQSLVQVDTAGEISYEDSIAIRSTLLCGVGFGPDFSPPNLTLEADGSSKRSDLYAMLLPFLIFSERALDVLHPYLCGAGQVLPVLAPFSGLKGFHVTTTIDNAVNVERSIFKVYPSATIFTHLVLHEDRVRGVDIFRLKEKPSVIFVSEEFRCSAEKAKLKGFSFEEDVSLSH